MCASLCHLPMFPCHATPSPATPVTPLSLQAVLAVLLKDGNSHAFTCERSCAASRGALDSFVAALHRPLNPLCLRTAAGPLKVPKVPHCHCPRGCLQPPAPPMSTTNPSQDEDTPHLAATWHKYDAHTEFTRLGCLGDGSAVPRITMRAALPCTMPEHMCSLVPVGGELPTPILARAAGGYVRRTYPTGCVAATQPGAVHY